MGQRREGEFFLGLDRASMLTNEMTSVAAGQNNVERF